MFKIIGRDIYCTRGDKGTIELKVPYGSGYYLFPAGSKIIFTVKESYPDSEPILRKTINVTTATSTVQINLAKTDTTIGELINNKKKYVYDISLGEDQTLVGHDDKGPRKFYLLPEASNDE